MKLTAIDLCGYGEFCASPAAFKCLRYRLPAPWDYVYTNGEALWRVRHDGGGYLQVDPPGGPALFYPERGQPAPAMLVWLIPEVAGPRRAFTNFWLPAIPLAAPGSEPEQYECTFSPEAADYLLRHEDWVVETRLWVPPVGAAAVMAVALTNTGGERRSCTIMPVVKPHLAPLTLATWDVPHIYQTAAFCRLGQAAVIWLETRDPSGDPARRLRAAVLSDLAPTSFEVAGGRFVGRGQWSAPEAVWRGRLALSARGSPSPSYGEVTRRNAAVGQPPLAALARKVSLPGGGRYQFTVVFAQLPPTPDGKLPARAELRRLAGFLRPPACARALRQVGRRYTRLFARRSLRAPDEAFSRYVTEFLPLQLDWVMQLDRGWPTGMRGTRDAAQDATAMVPLDPALARRRLREIFSVQRSDGWFPRQYSTTGRGGRHDLRNYVDAGLWVWELLWEYLCYTRDFALLDEKLPWLEAKRAAPVLEHAAKIFAYYLAPGNLGEHGLCKIRAGDWLDSVNRAGLEGRGESVMVSCQAVLGLQQAAELGEYLARRGGPRRLPQQGRQFREAADRLRRNLLAHARNRQGYFNGVFNDAGRWIFSPKDPDGRKRVSGPANAFAIIAGIVQGRERDRVFRALDFLQGPHGWRLFYPPIGDPPLEKLGRIGQGDLAPGVSENGTPYNHGAHGFLGRAAWSAGRGTLLYEVLKRMLPYDPKAHPVSVAKTAPYAVVNHWREALGLEGSGGDAFLTGSISVALRNCYQGLVGFRPELEYLAIDPCLPAAWGGLEATIPFLGAKYHLRVRNPARVECGVAELRLDGQPAGEHHSCPRWGRRLTRLPLAALEPGRDYVIDVKLGPC